MYHKLIHQRLGLLFFIGILVNMGFCTNLSAQPARKSYAIKISGNCEHCKERIENALDLPGVKSAKWNEKTSIALISLDTTKTTIVSLQEIVAKAGHDTPLFKAKEENYSKLPKCCRYTREGHKP